MDWRIIRKKMKRDYSGRSRRRVKCGESVEREVEVKRDMNEIIDEEGEEERHLSTGFCVFNFMRQDI